MSEIIKNLSLDSDTFEQAKNDFDLLLRNTIAAMIDGKGDEAKIKLEMSVKLQPGETVDHEVTAYKATREIIRPTFEHKVSVSMQYKDEKKGSLQGDYELVWDEQLVRYVLRAISDGRTSLFDNDRQKDNNDINIVVVGGELPEPKENPHDDVVDADFEDVPPDDYPYEDPEGDKNNG